MKLSTRLTTAAVALLLFVFAVTTQAQTIWTGNISSDLADNGNWTSGAPFYVTGTPPTIVGSINDGSTVTVTTAVTFANSQLVDTLNVGGSSNTTLNIQSGGTLEAIFLNIGNGSSDTGTVNVSGTLRGAGPPIQVGVDGVGTLEVMDGGVIKGPVNVAANAGSTGTFTLNSGASVLDDAEFSNSGSISGGDGNAAITLHGGQVDGSVSLGGVGSSTLTIDGSVTLGSNLVLGATAGGSTSGHIDGTDTVTVSANALLMGGDGTNSLVVDNNATFNTTSSGVSEIAGYGGGSSTVTIDGSGTTWTNTGQLLIGGTGTGTLNVTNGAAISHQQITLGGSSGGNGTLNVLSGSSVTAGNALIGYSSGGFGSVTVDGADSSFHVTTDFRVGDAGDASVTVSNSGHLQNDGAAYVGLTGSGSVLVTGSGSSWASGGDVTLAQNTSSASGTITLGDGGQLTINGGSGNLYLNTVDHGSGTLNLGAQIGDPVASPGFLYAATVDGSSSGGTANLIFNHNSSAYFFDAKITHGVFVVQRSGTTVLTAANDYTGGNFVSGGTLVSNNTNAFGSGDITLAGGGLELDGHSQTSGILTVSGNSFIDFNNNSTLIFANSSGVSWNGTLTLLNFDGSDTFRVGTTINGLTGTQLSLIDINGFIAAIDGSGYLSMSGTAFVAPAVPEPSTYAALAGLAALGLAAWRRKARLAVVTSREF